MSRKWVGSIVVVVTAATIALLYVSSEESPELTGNQTESATEDVTSVRNGEEKAPEIVRHPLADDMPPLNAKDTAPEEDLATIEMLLNEFAKLHDGHPNGENVEITAALMGNNPRHVAFLRSSKEFVNVAGELVDRWGTPYFFHQQSAKHTEIISAGPDGKFYTGDDLVR